MLVSSTEEGARYELSSPTAMPQAGGFLWNKKMMIQVTCRGYATAQFMQPEPTKYSRAPNIEARTFMQPEQNYYAHHPGRFFYVKDEETGRIFSAPHEPVRAKPDVFRFSQGLADVQWTVEALDGIRVDLTLTLPTEDVAELWKVKVSNLSGRARKISVYPYFVLGYMSWMNQSAAWQPHLGALVGNSITPYQKPEDYQKNLHLKDKTFLLCGTPPVSWEARQSAFEGEGGLHAPSSITDNEELSRSEATYEAPAAVVQYREALAPNGDNGNSVAEYRFLFGPALDEAEISAMRSKYLLSENGFSTAAAAYASYISSSQAPLRDVSTPDQDLNAFINHWLPRQVFYHGDVNRLTTDPQTRNYLQDSMGMSYLQPQTARAAFITALSQQNLKDGSLPDGTLLIPDGELKYINQIPHLDHNVWLPIALDTYLGETGDYDFLSLPIPSSSSSSSSSDATKKTVFDRLNLAMDYLLSVRDPERGLSYFAQGDWCDPMNMAGLKGKGVSGWLTLATAYALKVWADICERCPVSSSSSSSEALSSAAATEASHHYRKAAQQVNECANRHLWTTSTATAAGGDGGSGDKKESWYARGITDQGVPFGVPSDGEGRIWLNPQAWGILSGAAAEIAVPSPSSSPSSTIISSLIKTTTSHLLTPFGPLLFHPPFSGMRDDIGRVTQKFPGSAENGSVYNHAASFWLHALYSLILPSERRGEEGREEGGKEKEQEQEEIAEVAYQTLRFLIPGPSEKDYTQRGQLPVFVPNYYRGYSGPSHPTPPPSSSSSFAGEGGEEGKEERTAGRSSQLFNTGTTAWLYRDIIEGLFGLKGTPEGGLSVGRPRFPRVWWQRRGRGQGEEEETKAIKVVRLFRGARFEVEYTTTTNTKGQEGREGVWCDGVELREEERRVIRGVEKGRTYRVKVVVSCT